MATVNPKEVEKYLKGVDYPARKADLINHVKEKQQEFQQVIAILQQLPGETFNKPTDVAKALSELATRSPR